MKSASKIIQKFKKTQGWNDKTVLGIMRRFIEQNGMTVEFEHMLLEEADVEATFSDEEE